MVQEIYIIDDDESSTIVFRELFKNDKEYKFISVTSDRIDIALKNIPSIIIINEDAIDVDILELCKKIRNDDDNSITPIIVVSSNVSHVTILSGYPNKPSSIHNDPGIENPLVISFPSPST